MPLPPLIPVALRAQQMQFFPAFAAEKERPAFRGFGRLLSAQKFILFALAVTVGTMTGAAHLFFKLSGGESLDIGMRMHLKPLPPQHLPPPNH